MAVTLTIQNPKLFRGFCVEIGQPLGFMGEHGGSWCWVHMHFGVHFKDPVTFLVRTFGSRTGEEVWDFGDGSDKVVVNSGVVQPQSQNKGEYAKTVHSFSSPGHYVVRVERTNEFGFKAVGHLHVVVNE